MTLNPHQFGMEVKDYEGRVGERSHITRTAHGMVPMSAVREMHGVKGEVPGEHRNRQGEKWESFKDDVAERGIEDPIFITVDPGEHPKISEGSHRRDAAHELGHAAVPAEIRWFGHAERARA